MSTDAQPRSCGFRRCSDLRETARDLASVQAAVTAARKGDRDALGVLYEYYADKVYGHVLGIVRNEHEAEDVTQHVFAKLMTAIERYEPCAVPFSGWLLRVARNAALDHLRQRRAIPCEEVRGGEAGEDEAVHDRLRDIRQALEALPGNQREVVVLRHLVGLTPSEIADRMGRSEPSVHGLHNRARGALRTRLTELGSAPLTPVARAA
jgi:RNA polymerase sigma-70 factor (ECF subfamily)